MFTYVYVAITVHAFVSAAGVHNYKFLLYKIIVLMDISPSTYFTLSCFSVLIVYLVVLIEYVMITDDLLQNITCMHTLT